MNKVVDLVEVNPSGNSFYRQDSKSFTELADEEIVRRLKTMRGDSPYETGVLVYMSKRRYDEILLAEEEARKRV